MSRNLKENGRDTYFPPIKYIVLSHIALTMLFRVKFAQYHVCSEEFPTPKTLIKVFPLIFKNINRNMNQTYEALCPQVN
jgi:hypothetical protein